MRVRGILKNPYNSVRTWPYFIAQLHFLACLFENNWQRRKLQKNAINSNKPIDKFNALLGERFLGAGRQTANTGQCSEDKHLYRSHCSIKSLSCCSLYIYDNFLSSFVAGIEYYLDESFPYLKLQLNWSSFTSGIDKRRPS